MEELIMRILDIEAQAQEIVGAARAADKTLDADLDKETELLRKEIEAQTEKKTEEARRMSESAAKEKTDALRKKTEADIAALEKKYETDKDVWVGKIVSGIIG